MIKVFLVEDEVVVREGIKKNIDWAKNGYDFCGEARDGELAFPLIEKERPDIVITDIKMPFMDGLELSRLIKKELPETEIIILTGYNEFEYAKEGISIGVAEYLSKPISGDELLVEVNKVARRIREKKSSKSLQEKYQEDMKENQKLSRTRFFTSLVSGEKTMADLLDMARTVEIDISAVCYKIVLFQLKSLRHAQAEYSKQHVKATEEILSLCDELGIITFERNLEGLALLFKADSMEELDSLLDSFSRRVEAILLNYSHLQYFGGLGCSVDRMTSLHKSYETASFAFAHRYFMEESQMIDYRRQIEPEALQDDFNVASIDMSRVDKTHIDDFLKVGSSEEVDFFMDSFLNCFDNNYMVSLMFRQYIVMDVYFRVVAFVESLSHSKDEIEGIDMTSGTLLSAENSTAYLKRILRQAVLLRENTASNKYGEIVDKVISYINDNYATEDISLNTLASHVNVSPNHLSMIFSQETGQTFIKYLTDLRMNKAKELLKCTSKKSNEIGEAVGYRDPHYFSYIFKKTVGVTPTQYRSSHEA